MKIEIKDIYVAFAALSIFCMILIIGYFLLWSNIGKNRIDQINNKISVGMDLRDIKAVLGDPHDVYTKNDFLEGEKNLKKIYDDRDIDKKLRLPIKNKAFIYRYKRRSLIPLISLNYHLYVFFDEEDTVEKIFWGDDDIRPYWGY